MSLPQPNLYPAFNIVRLSHVELAVTDLAKSRAFYVDTLGLQVTDESKDAIYLRALEERGHHCIVLRRADKAEARDLGFKLYSEERACRWNGSSAHTSHALSAHAIRTAFRSNSIPRWTACRRSTRNTRSTRV